MNLKGLTRWCCCFVGIIATVAAGLSPFVTVGDCSVSIASTNWTFLGANPHVSTQVSTGNYCWQVRTPFISGSRLEIELCNAANPAQFFAYASNLSFASLKMPGYCVVLDTSPYVAGKVQDALLTPCANMLIVQWAYNVLDGHIASLASVGPVGGCLKTSVKAATSDIKVCWKFFCSIHL